MFDQLLESSRRDDFNKWSNIGFGQEITQEETIEVHLTHLIWSSAIYRLVQPYCTEPMIYHYFIALYLDIEEEYLVIK